MSRKLHVWVTPAGVVATGGLPPTVSLWYDHTDRLTGLTEPELIELIDRAKDALVQLQELPVGKLDRMTNVRDWLEMVVKPMDWRQLSFRGIWPYHTPEHNERAARYQAEADARFWGAFGNDSPFVTGFAEALGAPSTITFGPGPE